MTPPEDQNPDLDPGQIPEETIGSVEDAHGFFAQLPAPLAADLGIVAGVLMTHARRRAGEDAIVRLGRVAHSVFHLLSDGDDDDEGGDDGEDSDPDLDGRLEPSTEKNLTPKKKTVSN